MDIGSLCCKEENIMEIKAVKFRKDGFYGQPFVMGGEEGADKFDKNIRYRGSLQNYLIDTGDEVILVDTGLPSGTPEEAPDENSPAYTGKDNIRLHLFHHRRRCLGAKAHIDAFFIQVPGLEFQIFPEVFLERNFFLTVHAAAQIIVFLKQGD